MFDYRESGSDSDNYGSELGSHTSQGFGSHGGLSPLNGIAMDGDYGSMPGGDFLATNKFWSENAGEAEFFATGAHNIPTPTSVAIGLDGFTNGEISVAGEVDTYEITLELGKTYSFHLFGNSSGNRNSLSDTVMGLYSDENLNTQVAYNDDAFGGFYLSNSYFEYSPTETETFYVAAQAFSNLTGEYSLIVEDITDPAPQDSVDWGVNFHDSVIKVYFAGAGETYDGTTSLGWEAYQISDSLDALQTMAGVTGGLTVQRTNNAADANMFLVSYDANDNSSGSFGPAGTVGASVGKWNLQRYSFLRDGAYADGWSAGNGAYHTLLHEFGHALGLAHAHDGGGTSDRMPGVSSSTGDYGDFGLNQGAYTIMGYNYLGDVNGTDPGGTSATGQYGYALTPMALDIANLQARYGANMDFQTGNDTYWLQDANESGTGFRCVWDAGGVDTFRYGGARDAVIDLRAATLRFEEGGGGFLSNADGIYGGLTIANGAVIENATGGYGDDTLQGNGYDNVLIGGAGNDTMMGGSGNDAYEVTEAGDVVRELAAEGQDRVYAYIDYQLGGYVENLTLGGNALRGVGNTGNNELRGNDLGNVLIGGAGFDWMFGGLGNDTYEVTEVYDAVFENAGGGNDRVYAYVDYVLTDNVEALNLGGPAIWGSGNALDNEIIGNDLDNRFNGWAGNDFITGGGGDDVFFFYRPEGGDMGYDTLVDFDANGNDQMYWSTGFFSSAEQALGACWQVGNDVWVIHSANNTAVLANTQLADVGLDDFVIF